MTRLLSTEGAGEPIQIHDDLAFERPVNGLALAYWRDRCAGRTMPARTDIDPAGMRGFITNVGLVDVLTDERGQPAFRVRLAGTAIEDVFGPMQGKLLRELPPYFAARWTGLFVAMADDGVPRRITTRVAFKSQDFLRLEALFAPLSDAPPRVTMLFVCLAVWPDV